MYKFIAGLGVLIRFFILPNPFNSFENSFLINIAAEPILHGLTFFTAGIFYSSGDFPAGGSLLYLFFYSVHIGLLFLWSSLGAIILVAVLFLIVYCGGLFYVLTR